MKVYNYFKTAEDMKNGKIYATFTEEHDAERLHFESLSICTCCREWPAKSEPTAAPATGSLAGRVATAARVFLLVCCLSAADGLTAAPATDDLTPCELLTADPLAEVAEFAAAGLTVSHVTIKSLPAREIPAADVPALLTC